MTLRNSKILKTTVLATAMFTITPVAYGVTWDMPTAYPDNNYHTETVRRFAKAVSKATGGELTIRVHSRGSLYKGHQIKRAVQMGRAFIGERLLSAHANELPLFSVDSIPFLATSFEESALLWKVAKPIMNKALEEQNLKLLYSVPWPPQGFYTQKAINTVKDFAGLKMRGYNTITDNVTEALDAKPVKAGFAELPKALATGRADSFISSVSFAYDVKAWQNLSHYHDFRAWMPRNYVFVNLEAWNKLPRNVRKTVETVANLIEYGALQAVENQTNWYADQFRANGMTVIKASPQLQSALAERTQDVLKTYLKNAGDDGKKIIEKYQKLRARTKTP